VPDLAAVKDRHVGRSAAQFDDGAAELDLVRRQHCQRGGERLQDELGDLIAGPLHAFAEVLEHARKHRHQVDFGFEPGPCHPDGLADPTLLVDQVILGDGVQQLVVAPEADVARHVVHPGHIAGADLVSGDRHHAMRRAPGNMLPRDAAVDRPDLDARHALGALHGLVDGPGCLFDVAHDAAPYARAPLHAQSQDLGAGVARIAGDFGDHGDDLGRAEVQRGNQALWLVAHAPARTITWPA
jgi:hypothetical protein